MASIVLHSEKTSVLTFQYQQSWVLNASWKLLGMGAPQSSLKVSWRLLGMGALQSSLKTSWLVLPPKNREKNINKSMWLKQVKSGEMKGGIVKK